MIFLGYVDVYYKHKNEFKNKFLYNLKALHRFRVNYLLYYSKKIKYIIIKCSSIQIYYNQYRRNILST